MTTIWKFPLGVHDRQDVSMPKGAKVLCAKEQHGGICIWAMVDPDAPSESRTVLVFGTGHTVESPGEEAYVGTASLNGGALIFHVFVGEGSQ